MADVYGSINSAARASQESRGNLLLGGQANIPVRSAGECRGSLIFGGQADMPTRSPAAGRAGLVITNAVDIPAKSTGNHGISLKIGGKANIPARVAHEGVLRFFLNAAYGPGFIVRVQPHIKGGCAITFKGLPNKVVYWSLVGRGADGFECEPVGNLTCAWMETNDLGYCINYYIAPKNASDSGKTDRLIVRYAEHP